MRTDRPKRDNNNENPTGQKYKQELAVSDTRNVLLLLCLAVLQYQCQRRTIQQQSTGRERARVVLDNCPQNSKRQPRAMRLAGCLAAWQS
jgi:hypothetical protein